MADVWSSLTALMATLGGWVTAWPATLDDRLGALVAGAATAIAVALAVAIYLGSGYRTSRDILRHGVATVVVLGLLAFAAFDMRHTAFDYLGINPPKPAVGLETPPPRATALAANAVPNDVFAIRYRVM
jgi:membrane associated rhomboid family serine protease